MELQISSIGYENVSQHLYDKKFPPVSPLAGKKFKEELKSLNNVWKECLDRLRSNEIGEKEYKEDCCYKVYENRRPIVLGSIISGLGGGAAMITGVVLQNLPSLYVGLSMFLSCLPVSLVPLCGQQDKLNGFETEKNNSEKLLKKIGKSVELLNCIGELFAIWETIKNDLSTEKVSFLFEAFDRVQQSEITLTTQSVNEVEKLLLMDNICETVERKGLSNNELIKKWKKFSEIPTGMLESEIIQPIEIEAVRATRACYTNFLILRNHHTESQVESKVINARKYIEREFLVNPINT